MQNDRWTVDQPSRFFIFIELITNFIYELITNYIYIYIYISILSGYEVAFVHDLSSGFNNQDMSSLGLDLLDFV